MLFRSSCLFEHILTAVCALPESQSCHCEQGGLRRGGLTHALAARMPVITEDTRYLAPVIGKSRLQMRQYCQGVRTSKASDV